MLQVNGFLPFDKKDPVINGMDASQSHNPSDTSMGKPQSEPVTPTTLTDTEQAICKIVNSDGQLASPQSISEYVKILSDALMETDRVLLIQVYQRTMKGQEPKQQRDMFRELVSLGGLKTWKKWIGEGFDRLQTEFLVCIFELFKSVPMVLTDITSCRLNEIIVKVKKECTNKAVKRTSADLLKHWKNAFTQKKKPSVNPPPSTPSSKSASTSSEAAKNRAVAAQTSTASADSKLSSSSAARPMNSSASNTSSLSTTTSSKSITSKDVLGTLLSKPTPKIAISKRAAAAARLKESRTKPRRQLIQIEQPVLAKEDSAPKTVSASSSAAASNSLLAADSPKVADLPTIARFGNHAKKASSKKIRWADKHGSELVKIKYIESWRDLVPHAEEDSTGDSSALSFKSAAKKELKHEGDHLHRKNTAVLTGETPDPRSIRARKMRVIQPSREWTAPTPMFIPEDVRSKLPTQTTPEFQAQKQRTSMLMEMIVLEGETAPLSGVEWDRSAESSAVFQATPSRVPLEVNGEPDLSTHQQMGSVPPSITSSVNHTPQTSSQPAGHFAPNSVPFSHHAVSMSSAVVSAPMAPMVAASSAPTTVHYVSQSAPVLHHQVHTHTHTHPHTHPHQHIQQHIPTSQGPATYSDPILDQIPPQLHGLDRETIDFLLDHQDAIHHVFEEARRGHVSSQRVRELVRNNSAKYRHNANPNAHVPTPYNNNNSTSYSNKPGPGNSHHRNQSPNSNYNSNGYFGHQKHQQQGYHHKSGPNKRPYPSSAGRKVCTYFNSPSGCFHGAKCNYLHVENSEQNSYGAGATGAPHVKRYRAVARRN